MRLYFAAAFGNNYDRLVANRGVRNILLTFANPAEWEKALKVLPEVKGRFNLMVDSGAFSIWNRKSEKDLPTFDTWLKWIKTFVPEVRPFVREVVAVSFDTLPGRVHETPTPEQARASGEQSFADWRRAEAEGVSCIPVFHQHEPWDILERYLEHTNYLGLSPANDATADARQEWLVTEALPRLRESPRTKVHLFGFTAPSGLTVVPAYSADSSAVYNFTKYRVRPRARLLDDPGDGREDKFYQGRDFAWHWDDTRGVRDGIEMFLKLERDVTALWANRGVLWPLEEADSDVQHVNPDLLREAPWRGSFRMDNLRYIGLVRSIERYGCYLPLIVRELDDGALELVDGHKRRSIAQGVPLSVVPIINLGKINEIEAIERHLVLNSIHSEVDPMPYAGAVIKLAEALGDGVAQTILARDKADLTAMREFVKVGGLAEQKRDKNQGDFFSGKVDRLGRETSKAGEAPMEVQGKGEKPQRRPDEPRTEPEIELKATA